MHFRSFSRKRNINTLVTVTVTVTEKVKVYHTTQQSRILILKCSELQVSWTKSKKTGHNDNDDDME